MTDDPQTTIPGDAFAITRDYAAPRDRVWSAWSEAAQIQAWWGPAGCTIDLRRFEFRPGGFFHYAMRFPNAPVMWGRFLYREIAASERIVWLNSFSNEGCGITRAPFGAPFPLEMLNHVTMTATDGGTRVALHAWPHGASPEETAVFAASFDSMAQGYGGTFDRLGERLART
jgi:uncharacterized protein YndB with AHSA1/START domain